MADNVIVRVGEKEWVRGEDGYSPEVTIEDIAHGHRVTITDREHPEGQSVDLVNGISAYEQAVAGGYEGTEAEFNEELAAFDQKVKDTEQARDEAEFWADASVNANQWAQSARDDAWYFSGQAEKWAVGKNAGQDVPSSDPTYHNNAKYYAQEAGNAVTAVNAAKADALQAVENKSTAEQTAIEQKGEDVLDSIPEDYTELSGDVDDLKSAFDGVLEQDGNITYAETPATIAGTSQFPQFERNGNIFRVNGTFTGTRVFFRLSKSRYTDGNRTTGVSSARAWDKSVSIKAGHKYKGILTLLSGSYTASSYIAVSSFNTLSSAPVEFFPNTPKIMELNDTNCSVAFRIEGNATFTNAVFMFTLADVTDETALASPAINIAYSWWANNSVTDSYGVLYFGYIGKNAMCGVGCRYPNGKVCTKDIFQSEDCDDHNAPSVILVNIDGAEYVCVIGSTGHNTDNKINCYLAAKPNTILCEFVNKTYAIPEPSGYKFQCSYSQAFYDATNSAIYNFFRIKQINNSDNSYYMIWMVAISTNNGDSWDVYRVFATGVQSELFYMQSTPSGSPHIKGMVLQTNTTNSNVRPIRAGYVNLRSRNILHSSGSGTIGTISLLQEGELAYSTEISIANYNDFDALVPTTGIDENGFLADQYHYRILDTIYDPNYFLYAKSVEDTEDTHNVTDWILYRYANGVITEISHLGLAFFVGSAYVTGACFVGDIDTIVYSKNDSNTQDGAHSLHRVKISNNAIIADDVIKKSSMTIARPHRYDSGSFFALIGKYLEGTGTRYLTWHFSMAFFDFLP